MLRAAMASAYQLWRDSRGRLSPLRIATLVLLVTPLGLAAAAFLTDGFGARPLNDVIHRAGYWALVFLLSSLAVTPLRRIGRFGALVDVRRMIGVGAFCYAAVHILLYIADQQFNLLKVVSEIVLRLYLTIGFVALLGLTVLAVTSTDEMTRRLGGRRWRWLHRIAYVIAVLALIHYFQQTKADVSVPTFVAGLLTWLMGYRVLVWRRQGAGEPSTWALLALTLVVTVLVFVAEAIGLGIAYGVSPLAVLGMAFDIDLDNLDLIRPGWLVLAAGLCVVALDLVRARWRAARRPGGRREAAAGRVVAKPMGSMTKGATAGSKLALDPGLDRP